MSCVVVFDTNVLLSALFSLQGPPFRCLLLAREKHIRSVTCEEILDEFREKLEEKFGYSAAEALAAADEIRAISDLVTITGIMQIVVADPDDDKVLECAAVARATHVVTGDRRHLLPLRTCQGVGIVSPAEFFQIATTGS